MAALVVFLVLHFKQQDCFPNRFCLSPASSAVKLIWVVVPEADTASSPGIYL